MSAITCKEYVGSAEFSAEDELFYGKVLFIGDLISYESATAKGLKAAFVEAVDTYLRDCKAEGRQPDKPFKGSFNVRIDPRVHQRLAVRAALHGESLNACVGEILRKAVG